MMTREREKCYRKVHHDGRDFGKVISLQALLFLLWKMGITITTLMNSHLRWLGELKERESTGTPNCKGQPSLSLLRPLPILQEPREGGGHALTDSRVPLTSKAPGPWDNSKSSDSEPTDSPQP